MRPVINGDVNVIGAMLFGGNSPALREHLRRENEELMLTATPTWGAKAFERAQFLYDAYNGAVAVQKVHNALNNLAAISQPDRIYEFRTIEQFQTAQPMMQNLLMGNPYVRDFYHRGLCDGWSESYKDDAPGRIGFGHKAYEQVMNGIVQFDGETATYANYSGAWVSADNEALTAHEKCAMLNSWSHLERLFKEGEADPTSPWGGSL